MKNDNETEDQEVIQIDPIANTDIGETSGVVPPKKKWGWIKKSALVVLIAGFVYGGLMLGVFARGYGLIYQKEELIELESGEKSVTDCLKIAEAQVGEKDYILNSMFISNREALKFNNCFVTYFLDNGITGRVLGATIGMNVEIDNEYIRISTDLIHNENWGSSKSPKLLDWDELIEALRKDSQFEKDLQTALVETGRSNENEVVHIGSHLTHPELDGKSFYNWNVRILSEDISTERLVNAVTGEVEKRYVREKLNIHLHEENLGLK